MKTTTLSLSRGLVVAVGLIGLGLAVWAFGAARKAHALQTQLQEIQAELTQAKQASSRAEQASAQDIAILRRLLEEKEADLSAARQGPEPGQEADSGSTGTNDVSVTTSPDRAPGTGRRSSWMERLRTEDPERYQRIQEERKRWRKRVEAVFQEQFTRLDERMQYAQTEEEVELIDQIATTLEDLDGLRARWQELRELPQDERRTQAQKLAAESYQAYQNLTTLRAQDRELQLQQLATQVGYKEANQSQEFVDSVQRIYEETDTSVSRFMGFGRGGRGRFGGGGGGGQ